MVVLWLPLPQRSFTLVPSFGPNKIDLFGFVLLVGGQFLAAWVTATISYLLCYMLRT